jgi:hypothetical protein
LTSSKSEISGHLSSETFLIKIPIAKSSAIASEKLHGFECEVE